ncbi:outer membrane beta-barrel protein [Sinomicrobium weinanense]|uniref:Outer membrane beta-barrel protein n=1 Tax=Sinomicrobium weinanense TaxID=2842200 RepID=A0A926JPA9_9FLAO|nr:outer membrane beta-barrel protein [Sinomicrobium weinanense]MBC9794823.1 outer membrane beta-barrel protein [Sinomicrobium weinanense]MBU3125082.1 outer membrane beta-barrel protein [Sinomicrobium weinanense]
MKKIVSLIAIVLFAAGALHAQEDDQSLLKNKWLVGGAVGFSKDNNSGTETTDFSILPSVGFFLENDFAIGLSAGYEQTKVKIDGISSKKEFYGVLPYARKYWFPASKLMPFAQGDVRLGWAKDSSADNFAWGVNLRPGLTYRLNDSIAFDAIIGRFGYDNEGKDSDNYGFGLDLTELKLGIIVFL